MGRILAILALLSCVASATITRVQYAYTYPGDTAALTGVTAGDFLIGGAFFNSLSASPTCSDGVNSYSQVGATVYSSGGAAGGMVVFAAAAAAAGSITFSCTTAPDISVWIVEYSGVASSSPIDAHTTSSGASTVGPITTTETDGLVAFGGSENSCSNPAFASPFALIHSESSHLDWEYDNLNVAAGSISATSDFACPGDQVLALVAFLPGGAPPPATPVPRRRVGEK